MANNLKLDQELIDELKQMLAESHLDLIKRQEQIDALRAGIMQERAMVAGLLEKNDKELAVLRELRDAVAESTCGCMLGAVGGLELGSGDSDA